VEGRRGRDCMVVGFTTTYAISAYDPEKTTDLSQVRQTLSHNVVHLAMIEIRARNISGDRH
jgi:hypothetical protein